MLLMNFVRPFSEGILYIIFEYGAIVRVTAQSTLMSFMHSEPYYTRKYPPLVDRLSSLSM